MGFVYQYIVLIAVVALLTLAFIKTGEFNEILLGALVGVMVSLPMNKNNENTDSLQNIEEK